MVAISRRTFMTLSAGVGLTALPGAAQAPTDSDKRVEALRSTFALIWAAAEVHSNSRSAGSWHNVKHALQSRHDRYGAEAMACALEYLTALDLVERHPAKPFLVCLRLDRRHGIPFPAKQ